MNSYVWRIFDVYGQFIGIEEAPLETPIVDPYDLILIGPVVIKLVRQILERGVILGNWHFQPVPPDGACFTGHCGFDQSYLGELMRGIECLWLVARKK